MGLSLTLGMPPNSARGSAGRLLAFGSLDRHLTSPQPAHQRVRALHMWAVSISSCGGFWFVAQGWTAVTCPLDPPDPSAREGLLETELSELAEPVQRLLEFVREGAATVAGVEDNEAAGRPGLV